MASINVGFMENRNRSRILKPPGGGTSDIFGTAEIQQPKNTSVRKECAIKQIIEQKNEEIVVEKKNSVVVEEIIDNLKINEENENALNENKEETIEKVENGDKEIVKEEMIEDKTEKKTDEIVKDIKVVEKKAEIPDSTPTRFKNRVPPGGYSSGLW